MKARNAVIVAGAGIAAGFLVKQQLDRYQKITPEKALKKAKEAFNKQGPISGSWIYMKPEEYEKNGLLYNAYRGGITRNIDGENKQYEFFIDVDTGAVIESAETA
ncbi:peptidase M4 [Lentibacillus cibarius]|uniref:Peptidase M4 n=1 Tax=Lentibacillus cibarius TaxID=2583219 RepID=A0A549YN33_9BACI|nr:PepSY domain-containing protein [Lentibacillus cibarius]TMN23764.1 peptidase M4 [Lentibacillus cibarius]TRM13303.1 peptidase M4 [Lentibacillus cibarius]